MFVLLSLLLFVAFSKEKHFDFFSCISLCVIFILGLVGLFNKVLEGTNYIIVGIIMIWICSKAHHSGGGGEYMYIRGWIGAIISLVYGIFKKLNMI